MTITRYWHTARHMKARQVLNRITRRIASIKVPKHISVELRSTGRWTGPSLSQVSYLDNDCVSYLNERGALRDWQAKDKSQLWRYNQHYFDDLDAVSYENRCDLHREVMSDWIKNNPPGIGIGWDPYPTSLRIVNWCKWIMRSNEASEPMLCSLHQQVSVLSQRIEYHLMTNHLLTNAKALIFAGSVLESEESKYWLSLGSKIFVEQIEEQILADGGHIERSPMYHNIVLRDLLDVLQLSHQMTLLKELNELKEILVRPIKLMLQWSMSMSHPDGDLVFMNDTTLGIAPGTESLLDYAAGLDVVPEGLQDKHQIHTGFATIRTQRQYFVQDIGSPAPAYNPGHAHAGTLSFEWSLDGHRILVNSGVSEYGESADRLFQRGTSAHNSVVVDGLDSSVVWHGFRMAERAMVSQVEVGQEGDMIKVSASHDGYRRLNGKVTHRREVVLHEDGFTLDDHLVGDWRTANAYFYCHPGIEPNLKGDRVELMKSDVVVARLHVVGGITRIEQSTWHSGFGRSVPNSRIVVDLNRNQLVTTVRF